MNVRKTAGLWMALAVLGLMACGDDSSPAGGTDATTDTTADGADGGGDVEGDGGDAGGDTDAGPEVTPLTCEPSSAWTAGTSAFVEATGDWGLIDAGAMGTRLNAVDFDGDGWTDLIVRRGGIKPDDLSEGGTRYTWLLRNTGGGRFEDVTVFSGVLARRTDGQPDLGRPGTVYAAADVDNDGNLDLYVGLDTSIDEADSLGETSEILLGDGSGGFVLGPEANPIRRPGATDVPAGASFIDADRDGNVDIWVPQHNYSVAGGSIALQQDRLYLGDGTGLFTDVSFDVGLPTAPWNAISAINDGEAHTRAWGATACDLNGDGMTELLVPSYGRSPNHLWQGAWAESGIQFTNRSVVSGYAYDDDFTWQDNQFALCYCQSNPGAEGCAGLPNPLVQCPNPPNWNHDYDRQPFRLGGNSGATICADVDNDGDMDLFTSEIKHWWAGAGADGSNLLINTGDLDVAFDRPGDAAMGLAIDHSQEVSWDEGHMTGTVLDFDNDGWLDYYLGASDYAGNRGRLYHQTPDSAAGDGVPDFVELSTGEFFEHNRSHGVAAADFDRDGDLDIVVGHSRARCDANAPNNCYETPQVRLFLNTIGQSGNWIQLSLEGTGGSNRAAVGARVTVTSGGVTQTQEVGGGYGHYGAQNPLTLHFGLGETCTAEVTVRWPDATLTTETATLNGNRRWRWVQGASPVEDQ